MARSTGQAEASQEAANTIRESQAGGMLVRSYVRVDPIQPRHHKDCFAKQ